MRKLMQTVVVRRLALVGFFLFSQGSYAYYTTNDTGDIIAEKQYRAGVETNIVFNDMKGLNLVGRFDLGFNESSNFRFLLGGGAVGFQTGVLYKWVPIPDYENQPAIGIMGGFVFARNEGVNFLSTRIHPLVSKKFVTENGEFTPFASLPFGFTISKGKTTTPLQLALGSEWLPNGLTKLSFMAEVGFNMYESFGYVSVSAMLRFDEEQGLKFE